MTKIMVDKTVYKFMLDIVDRMIFKPKPVASKPKPVAKKSKLVKAKLTASKAKPGSAKVSSQGVYEARLQRSRALDRIIQNEMKENGLDYLGTLEQMRENRPDLMRAVFGGK